MDLGELVKTRELEISCRNALLSFNKKNKKDKLLEAENLLVYKVVVDDVMSKMKARIKYLESKNKKMTTQFEKILSRSRGKI